MPRERPFLLSALPPTRAQERLAVMVAVGLLVAFLITLPFMHHQLPRQDAFIPVVDSILFLSDLIAAVLLYAQFSVVRTWGLLTLASGYLFTALIIVPHALTFPGVFAPNGLLGAGLQSTVWLYIFWHLGLPCSAIAYALFKQKDTKQQVLQSSPSTAVILSIAVISVLGFAITWLVTAGAQFLPAIMVDEMHGNSIWQDVAAPLIIAISLTSIILMWRRRSSVLDLWLLVVMWAWLIETALLSTTVYRFSLVWYAGRIFGFLSSGFVLLVLLSESTMLYAQLALSVAAQERERERRRMSMEVMVASIAHELHQPLSAIVANGVSGVRMLGRTPPNLEEVRGSLEDIASEGRRANEIIESIRTMFSIAAQERVLLDINELVRETLTILRTELQNHGVTLRLELMPDLPRVHGHRGQLQQVLLNVITNGVESMDSVTDRAHLLTIQSTERPPDGVATLIEDSGTGIHPEHAQRIFEPFFTTKAEGMGLGLAICRSIVEAHGGRLSAAPGKQHGSVFRVDLPIAARTASSDHQKRALAH